MPLYRIGFRLSALFILSCFFSVLMAKDGVFSAENQKHVRGISRKYSPLKMFHADPPPRPVISELQQPSCDHPYGSFAIISPAGPQYAYSIDGSLFSDNPMWREIEPGTYAVMVKDKQTGLFSESVNVVIDPAPEPVPFLFATQTFTPGCSNPEAVVTIGFPLGEAYEYSMNDMPFQSGPVFNEVYPGINYFTARNKESGCTSPVFQLVVIGNVNVALPPHVKITRQPDCSEPSGTIAVDMLNPSNFEYSVNGLGWQSSPVFEKLLPGAYKVRYRDKFLGCVSGARTVVVNPVPLPPPPPLVNEQEVVYCQYEKNPLPFHAEGKNLRWYTQATGGTGQTVAPVPATIQHGEKTWYVTQTDDAFCESDRVGVTAVILPAPVIEITQPLLQVRFGREVLLPVRITPANALIQWTPTEGLNNPGVERPAAKPERSTWYFVQAVSDKGCIISDSLHVEVIKDLYIPNAFTPNGDGLNDTWNIPHLHLFGKQWVRVFDRKGELVFESRSGNPAWDGTRKGHKMPPATYHYVVDAGADGVFKGLLSLIR